MTLEQFNNALLELITEVKQDINDYATDFDCEPRTVPFTPATQVDDTTFDFKVLDIECRTRFFADGSVADWTGGPDGFMIQHANFEAWKHEWRTGLFETAMM